MVTGGIATGCRWATAPAPLACRGVCGGRLGTSCFGEGITGSRTSLCCLRLQSTIGTSVSIQLLPFRVRCFLFTTWATGLSTHRPDTECYCIFWHTRRTADSRDSCQVPNVFSRPVLTLCSKLNYECFLLMSFFDRPVWTFRDDGCTSLLLARTSSTSVNLSYDMLHNYVRNV